MPRGLGEPAPGVGDLADLAAEADLAHHDLAGDGVVGDGAGHGEGDGEVDAGLDQPHAADGRGVDVLVGDADAGPPLEHGEQQRQPAAVEPLGVAPGRRAGRDRHGERLDLDEQRPLALHRRHDDRARHAGAAVGEEQLRRVGHAGEARARSSRTGPSSSVDPKRCLTARSRRRAWWRSPSNDSTVSTTCSSTRGPASAPSLVTWPTSTMATPRRLASTTSCWAHSRTWADRPRRRRQPPVGDGLDAVDDDEPGRRAVDGVDDAGQRRLGGQPQLGAHGAEALGPQAHLLRALLGADVQRRARPPRQQLQQQRALADARLAAEQRDRARARCRRRAPGRARRCPSAGAGRAGRRCRGAGCSSAIAIGTAPAAGRARRVAVELLDQRVPRPAPRALARPLGVGRAALAAGVHGLRPGHGGIMTEGCHGDGDAAPSRFPESSRSRDRGLRIVGRATCLATAMAELAAGMPA